MNQQFCLIFHHLGSIVNYIQVEEAWDMNSDHSLILLTLIDTQIDEQIREASDWTWKRLLTYQFYQEKQKN